MERETDHPATTSDLVLMLPRYRRRPFLQISFAVASVLVGLVLLVTLASETLLGSALFGLLEGWGLLAYRARSGSAERITVNREGISWRTASGRSSSLAWREIQDADGVAWPSQLFVWFRVVGEDGRQMRALSNTPGLSALMREVADRAVRLPETTRQRVTLWAGSVDRGVRTLPSNMR